MYRYGVNTKGGSTLPDPNYFLDIDALAEEMDRAIEYVWSVDHAFWDAEYREVASQEIEQQSANHAGTPTNP